MTQSFVTHFAIGVDGGLSTGVAILREHELFGVFQGLWSDAFVWFDDALGRLADLRPSVNVVVAAERFARGSRGNPHSAQPHAQWVYGAVAARCAALDVEFVTQSPGEAKLLAPNQLLCAAGLYVTPNRVGQPDANDANDAVRHAVLVTARRRAVAFDRLLRSLR